MRLGSINIQAKREMSWRKEKEGEEEAIAMVESNKEERSESESESESENDKSGVGRTYECSFCKRGFNNAQALGGHMNIHRKDKAKARQQLQLQSEQQHEYQKPISSSSSSSSFSYNLPHPISPFSSSSSSSSFAPQMQRNYQAGGYYPFHFGSTNNNTVPLSFSSPPPFGGNPDYSHTRSTPLFGMYQYDHDHHLGADLSLKINSSSTLHPFLGDKQNNKHNQQDYTNNNDIDLELRLGYHP